MEPQARDKEVYFDQYCKGCKHFGKCVLEEPCFSCLDEPVNLGSHKPVKYEEDEKKKKEAKK